MTLKHLIKNIKTLTRLLEQNPKLLDNIVIVHYSCELLIWDNEEKKILIHKKPFAVSNTFHLCLESQVEAFLCEEFKVIKFIQPVVLNGSQRL